MAIIKVLITNGVMSTADCVIWLLEGLDEAMKIKVIKLYTLKGWKITDQDSGKSSNFSEIRKFLDDEVKTNEHVAVYVRDHTMQANADIDDAKTILHSASTTAVESPMPAPMDPAIQALTEQMTVRTLLVKSGPSGGNLTTSMASPKLAAPTPIAVTACKGRTHFQVTPVGPRVTPAIP